jgi:hypothetical protein
MAGFTAAAALLGLVALVYGMVYGVSWLAGVARPLWTLERERPRGHEPFDRRRGCAMGHVLLVTGGI